MLLFKCLQCSFLNPNSHGIGTKKEAEQVIIKDYFLFLNTLQITNHYKPCQWGNEYIILYLSQKTN